MNALVTGGGGFLGRHIVMKLLARGDRVRILGRRSYPDWEARGVETLSADLQDKTAVEHACLGVDAVFHVAALAGYWGPWEAYYSPYVVGTEKVLSGCREGGVRQLIYNRTPSVVSGRRHL